ncbi:unnamed protein product, partial [marine sediment metagenome]
ARGFEGLGRFEEALAVLPTTDYENDPDRNDWMGELLMRLYAKVGQFDKTLEICRLRLKKDPKGHRTVKIAEQLGEATHYHVDGYNLLSPFLKDVKGEMSIRHYRRFCGAVKAYLTTHPAEQHRRDSKTNPVVLLRKGRQVEVPKKCRSFADFLEKVAYQADTIATGSFMGFHGERIRPPRFDLSSGSAFEILAAALDGKDVSMNITQDGYWEFNYSGDETRRVRYVGRGGLLYKFEEFICRPDREYIWLHPRIF